MSPESNITAYTHNNTHQCSESSCGQPLNVYELYGKIVGECKNPDCRLYNVTGIPDVLAAKTEQEREKWQAAKAKREALLAGLASKKA